MSDSITPLTMQYIHVQQEQPYHIIGLYSKYIFYTKYYSTWKFIYCKVNWRSVVI